MRQKKLIYQLLIRILYLTIVLIPLVNSINKGKITDDFQKIHQEIQNSDSKTPSENISNLKYNCSIVQHFITEYPINLKFDYNCESIIAQGDTIQITEIRKEFINKVNKTLFGYISQERKARHLSFIVFFIGSALFYAFNTVINKKIKLK